MSTRNEPNLGLATTKQLIDELAARAHVSDITGELWPGYRTVDSGYLISEDAPREVLVRGSAKAKTEIQNAAT